VNPVSVEKERVRNRLPITPDLRLKGNSLRATGRTGSQSSCILYLVREHSVVSLAMFARIWLAAVSCVG